MILLFALFFFLGGVGSAEPVFYRSRTIPIQELVRQEGAFVITDDKGLQVPVELWQHKSTKQIYWYRRLFTEVCLTGDCRPVDVGIYWNASGNYLGIEVFRENLTKTDHSVFSDFDYVKLESILRNEWSPLREFEFEELVDDAPQGTDATTGATKKVIADASVNDAVYTTYTLWHLIHVGEGEQLSLLTYRYLNRNPAVLEATVKGHDTAYLNFLMEGVSAGHLQINQALVGVIIEGLDSDEAVLKNTAFRAISHLPLNDPSIQNEIAKVYAGWEPQDKTRFLRSFAQVKVLGDGLYQQLSADLTTENVWFLSALLPVLAKSKKQRPEVVEKIKALQGADNSALQDAVRLFLSELNLSP